MGLPNVLPDKLSAEGDYLMYLENLAYLHKDIAHSASAKRFYSRVEDVVGVNVRYPIVMVIRDGVTYQGMRDALFEVFEFEIFVLKELGSGNAVKNNALVNECKVILDDIISRIERDSKPGGDFWPVVYFELTELSQMPVDAGLFDDKAVGYSAKVRLGNQKRFEFDSSKWIS